MLVVNGVVMITKEFIGLIGSIASGILCIIGCCVSGWCLWKNWRERFEMENREDRVENDRE